MSIRDCIRSAVDQGEMTLEDGQALEKRFDALFRKLNSRGAAREQLAKELEAEARERKRRALLTEARRKVLVPAILNHRNARGEQDPAQAFILLHEHFGDARFEDIENKRLAILGGAHAKLDALLYEMRKGAVTGDKRRHFGTARARLENVVRELFGEGTGDQAAKDLAAAWTDVSDGLRQRFNAAGGAVGKLESWGLPQHHDGDALLAAGLDKWISDITPRLDRERMRNALTGEKLTDDELREGLEVVWHRITSEGWVDREPSGTAVGRGALFKQHADHRFLHFKAADDWLSYQRSYGEGDPFAAMMGHVSTMSRDIATMETLGPNPEAMRNYLRQVVTKQAAMARPLERIIADLEQSFEAMRGQNSPYAEKLVKSLLAMTSVRRELDALRERGASKRRKKKIGALEAELDRMVAESEAISEAWTAEQKRLFNELKTAREQGAPVFAYKKGQDPMSIAGSALARADAMWDVMRGTANAPTNSRIANVLATTRNLVSAAALGSAAISAMSDIAFNKATRKFAGLKQAGVIDVIGGTIANFQAGTRREAVRAGLILDSAEHAMHRQARYAGSLNTKSLSGYMVDRVLAVSGLSPWTQAGKHAFGMAFQAELADRVGQAFADLPAALRATMERHGVTSDDWDVLRQAVLHEPKPGAVFLRPAEVAQGPGGEVLAEKYLAMILREMRHAVPEGTVRSRSVLTAGRPGTLIGEISRNFAQFKSFGVAVVMLHGGRIASEIGAGRGAKGAAYAVSLLITGTLFGGLAMQLKNLAQGKDPQDMSDPAFWGGALLQGGGMGIYGDFLFSGINRFGGGLTSTVAGPLPGRIDRLRNSTLGNALRVADEGTAPNLGRDAVNLVKDWTPGSSLWYARLAGERLLLDRLQMLLDPEARKAFKRKMSQQKSRVGNEFWWRPGERGPRRGPALGAALGR